MSRKCDNNKLNRKGNKRASFDKDHVITKEDYTGLTPITKEFWTYAPNKEKAFILSSVRDKPKPQPVFTDKPPFTRKVSNSEITDVLIYQHLALEEYFITVDSITTEYSR